MLRAALAHHIRDDGVESRFIAELRYSSQFHALRAGTAIDAINTDRRNDILIEELALCCGIVLAPVSVAARRFAAKPS